MSKAILISIKPKWVAKILNEEKTIEIRKKFPKDFVGWVYIYCTKARHYLVRGNGLVDNLTKEYDKNYIPEPKKFELYNFEDEGYSAEFYDFFNGKVVARFWCDKVEEINRYCTGRGISYKTETLNDIELCDKSCLDLIEIDHYLYFKKGYAIHITKLEIFDEPKELWQFKTLKNAERYKHDLEQAYKDDYEIGTRIVEGIANDDECANCVELTELSEGYYGLQKPPQSWCFVEI